MVSHVLDSKNVELKDYVGICHYRRYFDFLDDVPNIEEIFKECDAIIRKPHKLPISIKEQYESCHNIEDLNLMGEILKENFEGYYPIYNAFMKSKYFVPCNMVILKKDDFLELVNFGKEFLKEFLWRTNVDVYKRVFENEEKYVKKFYPNSTHNYQIRMLSFLLERLTNIFIFKKYKKLKAYNVIVTENKYNVKDNTI